MKKLVLIAMLGALVMTGCDRESVEIRGEPTLPLEKGDFTKPFAVPPLLKDEDPHPGRVEYSLSPRESSATFFEGKTTKTLGYDAPYLGPTITVKTGSRVKINVRNRLDETTTVHWHGLHVNGDDDGGPHQPIVPGATWSPSFYVRQPASTAWYHPHAEGSTAEQVYRGLAGLFYIDDGTAKNLNLPRDYGKDDFPLVVQDRIFSRNGRLVYKESTVFSRNGIFGDTILVNGVDEPLLKVGRGLVRLRLVNGSNARIYRFFLSDKSSFSQIASDGGFLDAPVVLKSLELSPGERAEIVVDFSEYEPGKSVFLLDEQFRIAKFVVSKKRARRKILPAKLAAIERLNEYDAQKTRKFVLESAGGGESSRDLTINGKSFDHSRIDDVVRAGALEIWEISNPSNYALHLNEHPMHIHGVSFQILSRDGRLPPRNERGWKDTVLLHEDETVRIIIKFADDKGTFMFHCHILEHEEAGMMSQYQLK